MLSLSLTLSLSFFWNALLYPDNYSLALQQKVKPVICLSISFIWAGLTCAETWKNTGCLAECNRCVHNVKVKWMKRIRPELKSYLRVTSNFNSHIMQYLLCECFPLTMRLRLVSELTEFILLSLRRFLNFRFANTCIYASESAVWHHKGLTSTPPSVSVLQISGNA